MLDRLLHDSPSTSPLLFSLALLLHICSVFFHYIQLVLHHKKIVKLILAMKYLGLGLCSWGQYLLVWGFMNIMFNIGVLEVGLPTLLYTPSLEVLPISLGHICQCIFYIVNLFTFINKYKILILLKYLLRRMK